MSVLDLEEEGRGETLPNNVEIMSFGCFMDALRCSHCLSIKNDGERQNAISKWLDQRADELRQAADLLDRAIRWSVAPGPSDFHDKAINHRLVWPAVHNHLRKMARMAYLWNGHIMLGTVLEESDRVNPVTGELIR